jgi:hypothetical protein
MSTLAPTSPDKQKDLATAELPAAVTAETAENVTEKVS